MDVKHCSVICCNVFHSSRKIKGDFVDCEQVKCIIINNGQYTYFINIADLSRIFINRNGELYESNKVEEEVLSGEKAIIFNCSDGEDCGS